MKLILMLATLGLVSCASDVKDWDLTEPDDSTMTVKDRMQSRAYNSHTIERERKAIADRETRE